MRGPPGGKPRRPGDPDGSHGGKGGRGGGRGRVFPRRRGCEKGPQPSTSRPHRTLRALGTHCGVRADRQIWVHFGVCKMSPWLWGQRRAKEACWQEGSSEQTGVSLLPRLPRITGGNGAGAPVALTGTPTVPTRCTFFCPSLSFPVQFPADPGACAGPREGTGLHPGCCRVAQGLFQREPRLRKLPQARGSGLVQAPPSCNSSTFLGPFKIIIETV